MNTCPRCEGFAPPSFDCCPHCDAAIAPSAPAADGAATRLLKRAGQAAAAAATAITLMACYGAPEDFVDYVPPTDPVTACNQAEQLLLDSTFTDNTYTQGAGNALEPSCAAQTGSSERIYQFTAPDAGGLHFEWVSDAAVSVSARLVCTASPELLCEPPTTDGAIDVDLSSGEEVFLIVEGATATSFDFTASFTPLP